jgi:HEAT repeat protein
VDLARSQSDPDLRREALKAVAEATPPDVALPVLEAVARGDRDGDVQREAVKVLAKVHDRRAVALLIHFARRHPMPEARREAVEALGEADPSDSAVALLQAIALDGSDGNLQLKAVKSLGKLHRARALGRVARDARDVEVRREAVEHYAEIVAPDTALVFLTERLASDPSPDVQLKALHWLAKLPDGAGLAALAEAARAHPNREVRREARRLEDRSR